MLSAIILAAGESSRMGRPKALLLWRGLPFIEHVCASLRAAGVQDRVVVLGGAAAEILAAWRPAGEKTTVNPKPEEGQLSSLRAGLEAAVKDSEGFLVCLADQPTIEPETYKKVISAWALDKGAIIIPRVPRPGRKPGEPPYKRGHPILIPAAHLRLCFEGPLDQGLHWVTHHPSARVLDLDAGDPEIIRDFDTPEDYARLEPG
jgi:molybdenum cofactor cytidylyltransferase